MKGDFQLSITNFSIPNYLIQIALHAFVTCKDLSTGLLRLTHREILQSETVDHVLSPRLGCNRTWWWAHCEPVVENIAAPRKSVQTSSVCGKGRLIHRCSVWSMQVHTKADVGGLCHRHHWGRNPSSLCYALCFKPFQLLWNSFTQQMAIGVDSAELVAHQNTLWLCGWTPQQRQYPRCCWQ